VVDRRLTSSALETELREIVHERDDVVHDGFDDAVLAGPVLDLPSAVDCNALFESAADELAGPLGLPAAEIAAGLKAREKDMTTAVTEFAAVPHMVVDGSGAFAILVARCREGVRFSEQADAVKAVFVIVGSADRRMEHLKALAAIANILQERDFAQRWLAARDATQLRESLLLSGRPRGRRNEKA
jgi:mannitol/fructose-specific phosphotransferase system IIA component (Ntr-type)